MLAQRLHAAGLPNAPERWALPDVLFAALQTFDVRGAIVLGEPTAASHASLLPDARTQAAKLATELDRRSADVASADTWLQHSQTRTYLLSRRFDRVGPQGRRHVVAIGAVHEGLLGGAYQHWSHSGHQLASRKQLSVADAGQIDTALHFGRLIGNTDMHSGNLSRFSLAPIYDMLPMRWRPDASMGVPDHRAFDPHPLSLQSPARPLALAFWRALAGDSRFSAGLREVAEEMVGRMAG